MNNNPHPMLPQAQPAVPLQNGRRSHNNSYPHPQQHALYNPGYQYQYPARSPSQQWSPPFPVPIPTQRIYSPYSPMTPYTMPQNVAPIRPVPYQALSSSSIRSPTSSNASLHPPSSRSRNATDAYLAPSSTPPTPPSVSSPTRRRPFYPPLPWQSFDGPFGPRAPRRRRRRTPAPQTSNIPVELPSCRESFNEEEAVSKPITSDQEPAVLGEDSLPDRLTLETPTTTNPPSEALSTQPTTPSSTIPYQQTSSKPQPPIRPQVPIIPIIPAIPNVQLGPRPFRRASMSATSDIRNDEVPSNADHLAKAMQVATQTNERKSEVLSTVEDVTSLPKTTPPKSWADLVRTKGTSNSSAKGQVVGESAPHTNGHAPAKARSLADALSSYTVTDSRESAKIAFLEPRGLVNTGNMCYMNAILQILVFCVPFYNFLEDIGKQAAHSFNSSTPLMDAMIIFMREFPVIDAAVTIDQLRMRLKETELEQYGEAFIPEFVYEVIRRLPRFSSMRRGHQQDAEEFLGFILEEMHDECNRAMKTLNATFASGPSTPTNGVSSPASESSSPLTADQGAWFEVGPRQKAAITRSSGAIARGSPVTKIFGGKLRSELRVPGMKHSVTSEPYQPLQLDIGAPNVSNIIDALRGLTKPETLHGDFNSPRGPGSTATKQVSIETLPQVLILHLKRFQYNSSGGTQKIWKKVGYPLDLVIPKEVFPQHKRGGLVAHRGLPNYQLIGVVYHHGKSASGGHYTVDVRRQEGREWIRIDDTVIRRIRSEDIAEGGSEEDPKVLTAALEQHKSGEHQSSNVYDQFAAEEDFQKDDSKGWSQVNGVNLASSLNGEKVLGVANGKTTSSSGKRTPIGRSSVKDNKVAYILFYQRVNL